MAPNPSADGGAGQPIEAPSDRWEGMLSRDVEVLSEKGRKSFTWAMQSVQYSYAESYPTVDPAHSAP